MGLEALGGCLGLMESMNLGLGVDVRAEGFGF